MSTEKTVSRIQVIHIVDNTKRHLRKAAKKGAITFKRNCRIKAITTEIDAEWEKRQKAS